MTGAGGLKTSKVSVRAASWGEGEKQLDVSTGHNQNSRFNEARATSTVRSGIALASLPSRPPISPSSAPLALFFPRLPPP